MERASVSETISYADCTGRELAQYHTQAETIYAQTQAAAAQWRRLGEEPRHPIQRATLDEIEMHLLYCAALGRVHQASVNPDHYFGQTPEQIAEGVAARAKARRRGAGARAVVRKYGPEAAQRITGHAIRH